jgi:hypothetical protein
MIDRRNGFTGGKHTQFERYHVKRANIKHRALSQDSTFDNFKLSLEVLCLYFLGVI